MVDTNDKISALYKTISESEAGKKLKILCYPSNDYKGFSYIKIYNKNADKDYMIKYLSELCGVREIVPIKAEKHGLCGIARALKRSFEPLVITKLLHNYYKP